MNADNVNRCGHCNWCIIQDAPPGTYAPNELVNTCPHGFGCCQNCQRCTPPIGSGDVSG